jgi:phosphoglycolate phosphatase
VKYAAVIFDLDGTLLDTIEDLADSMNAALQEEGHAVHAIDAYRYFVGDGIENLVRRALPESARNEESVNRGKAAMETEYNKRWNAKSRPYTGVPELLDELTQRQIPIAILSNKPEPFTLLAINELLSPWTFFPIRGARPDTPRKPDPTGALVVAEELGVEPAKCLYLGDTDTDMKTAVGAGMYALGATWGFRLGEELLRTGAQTLLDEPMELLELL